MAVVNVIFRLHLIESERGWGQKQFYVDFDTRAEAEQAMTEQNNYNNNLSCVPIYYICAERIEMLEAT